MTERDACALLKARFEAAGYAIAENQPFDEHGIAFEIDGFDAAARVGYEYVSDEAGDTWDVDDTVVAALAAQLRAGTLSILVIGENDAPDAGSLARVADAFLAGIAQPKKSAAPAAKKPAGKAPAAGKAAGKTPAAGKAAGKTPAAGKAAGKTPAAKKPETAKKPDAAKKPAAKKAASKSKK